VSHDSAMPPHITRVSTGIPGLDEVTGGGFLKSGVYIFQGVPGAGKTILANQIVHRHAANGGHVVYVTLLAESHGRLLQHMEGFSFFDASALAEKVYHVSAFDALRSGGLPAVVELLHTEMRSHQAGIVVLDGLVMAASAAASEEALKMFVSEIQAHSTLTGCTTLLLTSENADRQVSAEQTMVDGILLLRERAFGPQRERNLEVVKFRGSNTLRGNHAFQIGPNGITVYPRLESLRREASGAAVLAEGLSTGVQGLDAMFDIGGYARGSVTTLAGISGSGKTSVALHFASQASARERALYLSFYESPELLVRTMDLLGIARPDLVQGGHLEFLWQPFGENLLDALATRVLDRVREGRVARLVIDGVGGFMAAPAYAERGGPFLAAFGNELRRLGVTTLLVAEQSERDGQRTLDTPTLSAIADTELQLQVRTDSRIQRFVAIRKSRASRCDVRVREILLTPTGLTLAQEDPSLAA
jgi:circadian clock protein KaiC